MKKEDISQEQYQKILECFMQSLMKHGLKATTMDSVATALQMSKRTLYEIFENKETIFRESVIFFHKKMRTRITEIFSNSNNVMEGIIKCFLYNRDIMSRLNPSFMNDLEEYANRKKMFPEEHQMHQYQNLYEVLQRGVEEGFFRSDINLMVQCRMLTLQMAALKKTEELFPEDISLLEIYDTIIITFLRGISTQKGLEQLDNICLISLP